MIYLTGGHPRELPQREDLGEMMTPGKGNVPRAGIWWAADSGLFSAKGTREFDLTGYLGWLDKRRVYRHRCLFATAPDVVGDWHATWARSRDVLPEIARLGYRPALVAQDGMTALPDGNYGCLFVGGSTAWKLSERAYDLAAQAQARGLWTHLGRVNSFRRMRAAQISTYDSADGTHVAFAPDRGLLDVIGWLDGIKRQPSLLMAAQQ